MAAADEGIVIPISVKGSKEAAAAIGESANALQEFAAKAKSAGSSANVFAKAAGAQSSANLANALSISKMSSAVGALTPLIGRASQTFAEFTQIGTVAGGTIRTMTSLIGGPLGLAFGVATAAGGAFVTMLNNQKEQARLATDQVESLTLALDDYINLARKKREDEERARSIVTGEASVDVLSGANNQLLAERNKLVRQGNEALEHYRKLQSAGLADSTRGQAALQQLNYLRDNVRALDAQVRATSSHIAAKAAQVAPSEGGGGRGGRGGRGGGGGPRESSLDALMQRDPRDTSFLGNVGSLDLGDNESLDPQMTMTGLGKSEGSSKGQRAFAKASNAAARSMEADARRVQDAWGDAGSAISDTMQGVFADMVMGGEVSTAAVMKSLGTELVGLGTKNLFEGAAMAIMGNPAGASLAAIGAAEVAAGAGMGAAAKSMGGGGGGAARPSPGMNDGGGSGRGERGPTIINVHALNPTAETGRAIERSVRNASRKRGGAN